MSSHLGSWSRAGVVAALLLVLLAAAQPHLPTARAAPDWLDTINAYRTTAGLGTVVLNTDPNAGPTNDDAVAHSKYLVLNNTIGHTEDQAKPGFSARGAQAGAQGDVSVSGGTIDPVRAVQGFLVGGYHWEPILDPRTTAVAFGIYTDPTQQGWQSASTLVFIRNGATRTAAPVLWPPDGGQAPAEALTRGPGESPDPMANCPNYPATTGAAISVQLPTAPQVTGVTLTQDGATAPLTTCWFSAANVQFKPEDVGVWDGVGRSILQGQNVVQLFPQQPLGPGVYHVQVLNNGTTVCAWSFSVGQTPPKADNACGQPAGGTPPATANPTTPPATTPTTPVAPTTPPGTNPPAATNPPPAANPPTTTNPPATTTTTSLTGTWAIDDFGFGAGGALTLTQNGTQVTGAYSYADPSGCGMQTGTITGTLAGNALTFSFTETGCSGDGAGTGALTLSADGTSFTGNRNGRRTGQ